MSPIIFPSFSLSHEKKVFIKIFLGRFSTFQISAEIRPFLPGSGPTKVLHLALGSLTFAGNNDNFNMKFQNSQNAMYLLPFLPILAESGISKQFFDTDHC
jgi:hypothetical protein